MTGYPQVNFNPYSMYQNWGYGYQYPVFRGVQNLPQPVNVPQPNVNLQTPPDTVSFKATEHIQPKKEGLSTGAKWGLGALALVGIGAAVYFATRGRGKINLNANQEAKIKELISNGKLDEKHAEIFKSIEHLEGDDFIKEAYKRIAKSMGYDRLTCPQLEIISKNSSSSTNVRRIKIDKLGFATKEQQVGTIRHELEHFRQKDIMYRALGKDATLDAMVEPSINKLKYNEQFCIEKLGKKYSELTEKELQAYRSKLRAEFDNPEKFDILDLLLEVKGKISKGTAEYAEAEKILKARKEYITPTAVVNEPLTSELLNRLKVENPKVHKALLEANRIYENSYLETEARSVEGKIQEMYRHFCEAIKN